MEGGSEKCHNITNELKSPSHLPLAKLLFQRLNQRHFCKKEQIIFPFKIGEPISRVLYTFDLKPSSLGRGVRPRELATDKHFPHLHHTIHTYLFKVTLFRSTIAEDPLPLTKNSLKYQQSRLRSILTDR